MVLEVVASDGTSRTMLNRMIPPAPGVVGSVTKLVVPFTLFGLADPPVAAVGIQFDAGAAEVVATRESIDLLEFPAVPAKTVLATVVAAPTAGNDPPS